MKNNQPTRRQFMARSGAVGAGVTALGWSSLIRGANPSQQIRIAVIGCGVRGKYLIGNLPPARTRVVAICDCAESRMHETVHPTERFSEVLSHFSGNDARSCRRYQDYRKMIDQEKLDAVIIATPDHHHVQAAMLALHAGLDVYVEKPLSLTIREGRLLADTVKSTGRVLQVGSQQRTMEVNQFACEFVRDGGLGKISRVDFPNYPGPYAKSQFPAEPIPKGLDWDLFLGPSPERAHNKMLWVKDDFKVGGLMWRGWDLYRDYSGHLVTNWGGHNADMVQYALGMDDSGPTKIELLSGISEAELKKDWEQKWRKKTPAPEGSFAADPRFKPVRMTYSGAIEMNLLPGIGTATFYGERGQMAISRNKFICEGEDLVVDGPGEEIAKRWAGAGFVARPHLENWLDCIESRSTPNAPVEVGHRTATVCHLVNLVRELDRPLHWNPETEQFQDDDAANELLDRPRRPGFELA